MPPPTDRKIGSAPKFTSFTPSSTTTHESATTGDRKRADGERSSSAKRSRRDVEEDHGHADRGEGREHADRKRSKHHHSTPASHDQSHHERHHRHRHRHRHHRCPSPDARTDHHDDKPRKPAQTPRHDAPEHSADADGLFTIDTRGDPLIVRYGSNHRPFFSSYRRIAGGRLILGSDGILDVRWNGSKPEFTIIDRAARAHAASVFRDKKLISEYQRSGIKPRHIRPLPELPPESEDYIPLNSSLPHAGDFQPEADDGDDDSARDGDDDDEEAEIELTSTKKRSIELNRHVRDRPEDAEACIELVQLQETLFNENRVESGDEAALAKGTRTPEEAIALAHLKLAIVEKALSSVKSAADREVLLVARMREGAKVWAPKALSQRWDTVVDQNRDICDDPALGYGFLLWKARLDHDLTNIATFSFDSLSKSFTERLKLLDKALAEGSENDLGMLSAQAIYVFLRATRFLHESGYIELAVAAWQAMLELTFAAPEPDAHLDSKSTKDHLSVFWEAEVCPRIGEAGAKGWWNFDEEQAWENVSEPEPKHTTKKPSKLSTDSQVKAQDGGPFKAWLALERQGAAECRTPARKMDTGVEDDPFRLVLFSDIEHFLVLLPRNGDRCIRGRLVEAFLRFCHLPSAGLSSDWQTPKYGLDDDAFVNGQSMAFRPCLAREKRKGAEDADSGDATATRRPHFDWDGGNMALSQEVLFSGPGWYSYFPSWSSMYGPDDEQVDLSWILNTLRFLAMDARFDDLAEYYLAMEWRNTPGGAVAKVARGLLKHQPSNVRLYNAYAMVELANGNADKADGILLAAARHNLSTPASTDQILWNTWAWACYCRGLGPQVALLHLCCSVDAELRGRLAQSSSDSGGLWYSGKSQPLEEPSPALLLKTKSLLAAKRDYLLSNRQLEAALPCVESLALIEYFCASPASSWPPSNLLQKQGNISAAISSLEAFATELQARSFGQSSHHEQLLQFASRLLYHFATHG